MEREIRVGVVGYCPPTRFNEVRARGIIIEAYIRIELTFCRSKLCPGTRITIVSGLTNVGVLKIAYEQATERRWKTVGIACKRAEEYELYPVDEKIIVGENWGDESPTFLEQIDMIIRIGNGKQSMLETAYIKSQKKLAFEYELEALP